MCTLLTADSVYRISRPLKALGKKAKQASYFEKTDFRVYYFSWMTDFTNEKCILSCFLSLNNKKICASCQKSNFPCIKIREFVFVGFFALLYCHGFRQFWRKLQKLSIYIVPFNDTNHPKSASNLSKLSINFSEGQSYSTLDRVDLREQNKF